MEINGNILTDALFGNLKLLGFESYCIRMNHSFQLTADSLIKPNQRTFELMTYFLLKCYNADECFSRFKSCFPIKDAKQKTDFGANAREWIKDIAKNPHAHFPRVIPIYFVSPGGDGFCHLYLELSNYVIALKYGGKNATINADINAQNVNALIKKHLDSRDEIIKKIDERFEYCNEKINNFLGKINALKELIETDREMSNNLQEIKFEDCEVNANGDKCTHYSEMIIEIRKLKDEIRLENEKDNNGREIFNNAIQIAEKSPLSTKQCDESGNAQNCKFETIARQVEVYNDMLQKIPPESVKGLDNTVSSYAESMRFRGLNNTQNQMITLLEHLKHLTSIKRSELLNNPIIAKRRDSIKNRMCVQKLKFDIRLSDTKVKDKRSLIEKIKKESENRVIKGNHRLSALDYSFHLADMSTFEYIPPREIPDDSFYLSPVREVDSYKNESDSTLYPDF